jgi:serine/threonine protein kinase
MEDRSRRSDPNLDATAPFQRTEGSDSNLPADVHDASTMSRGGADDESAVVPGPSLTGAGSPVPDRIGRFQIRRVLGEGSFGRVYAAHDPQLDRAVALKVPNRRLFETGVSKEASWPKHARRRSSSILDWLPSTTCRWNRTCRSSCRN